MTVRTSAMQAPTSSGASGIPAWFSIGLSLAALGLQALLPTLLPSLALVNLPLLAVSYLVLSYRTVIPAILASVVIGWVQDGLTHGPIGVYGLVYTLLGYSAGTASQFFKVHLTLVLGVFLGLVYWLHELALFGVRQYILGQQSSPELGTWTALAALHAGLGLVVFPVFDRIARAR